MRANILRYMEDITFKYQSDMQPWIKVLQGLVNGIQCIGGELPLYFYSGWIIERIGHENCMSLGLLAFSVRFYLYSVITNPVWILPVEFVNGITFGLFHAVLMSYARIIAPENAVTTLVGISGSLFEGVGTYMFVFVFGFDFTRSFSGEKKNSNDKRNRFSAYRHFLVAFLTVYMCTLSRLRFSFGLKSFKLKTNRITIVF